MTLAKMTLMASLMLLAACSQESPRVISEEVVDLLFTEPGFEIIQTPEGMQAGAIGIDFLRVSPAKFEPHVLAGARELPALIFPTGSLVQLTVPSSLSGEFELRGGFAIDFQEQKSRRQRVKARVDFSVCILRDGERLQAFETTLTVKGKQPDPVGWAEIVDRETNAPLRVRPGDLIQFGARFSQALKAKDSTMPKLGVAGLSLCSIREVPLAKSSKEKPNVVFILMDTLRADRTTGHGYPKSATPSLDKLATFGTVYTGARSTSSWTWPSTASMLTGLAPAEHGIIKPGSTWLRSEHVTIAEHMQRAGMATAAFTGNRLISGDFNFSQGFQTFSGPNRNAFIDGDELLGEAYDWLDEHRDERFFLYLHLVDPHRSYEPVDESLAAIPGVAPDGARSHQIDGQVVGLSAESATIPARRERPLLGQYLRPEDIDWMDLSYDQVVHTGDYWLGLMLERLVELGLDKNTVVVFTSDHGEEFYEHGDYLHGQALWPELVHVPLVIAGPGIPAGRIVDGLVSNADLFGYLGSVSEGVDPANPTQPLAVDAGPVFYSTERGQWNGERKLALLGVEEQRWVLHFAPAFDEVHLFDRLVDPEQRHDLSASEPEQVARLKAMILKRIQVADSRRLGTGNLGDGSGAIEALKDIGYL